MIFPSALQNQRIQNKHLKKKKKNQASQLFILKSGEEINATFFIWSCV